MYILGITGGIGSGKSTASNYLKNKGAVIFNADQEAKKHLKHTKILQNRIIDAFGQKVVEKNKLSISKLAETAFSSKIDQKTNIPYYSSIIELDETPDFRDVSIQSGMTTEISIIGQERTVFGFIFNPVTKLTREAFRE